MRLWLALALVIGLALAMGGTALAETVSGVSYLYYESEEAAIAGSASSGTQDCTKVGASSSGVTWSSGWYVVSQSVEIKGRITVSGNVHLILADGQTLTASRGITVEGNNSLSIYAQSTGDSMGTLEATGVAEEYEYYPAGIGSYSGAGGTVTINGGNVFVQGSSSDSGGGAGIGGCYSIKTYEGTVGVNVTINGGNVTAIGGMASPGIGDGPMYASDEEDLHPFSLVTINGGNVKANGNSVEEGGGAAGIGGGYRSHGVNVTINGGDVTANGGHGAAGIGDGTDYAGKYAATITVTGGTVTASGGDSYNDGYGEYAHGAGIGGAGKYNEQTTENRGRLIFSDDVKIYAGGSPNPTTEHAFDGDFPGWPYFVATHTYQYVILVGPTASSTFNVTVIPGDYMVKTEDSGDEAQTGLSGPMTDVVYTAETGYYFPLDYSVSPVNDISVTRDSYTQITVSGTPTANTEIVLTAPTAKEKPDAPTTVDAVDCTTADNDDGQLTGVTTDMEYKASDAEDWTDGSESDITGLTPGTYYVRVKETDTALASDNTELTIKAFISATVTFQVVNGSWDEGEGEDATNDQIVTLTGHEGDTLTLTADKIPAVGNKPDENYKAGDWDTEPNTTTTFEPDSTTTYIYTYAQKERISATVFFEVDNGSWDEGEGEEATAVKEVTLEGYDGEDLKLTADQIPAVGNRPNNNYKMGSWNTTPDTTTTFTNGSTTTYIYTYAQKERISATVFFEVDNGSWDEGEGEEATAVKEVTLEGYEGDHLNLTADQIPAVGNRPDENYRAGEWDTEPDTTTNFEPGSTTIYTYTYAQKEAISATVKFQVVNGSWDEGEGEEATAVKEVTLEGYEGDHLNLTADQIPAVGNRPDENYKAGEWDTEPDTTTNFEPGSTTTFTYTYAQKDPISATVTFKVIGGSWDDGEGDAATDDQEVTLQGYEDDELKLTADQIPAVGSRPDENYRAGAWDVEPDTETEITADTVYTYTYEAKTEWEPKDQTIGDDDQIEYDSGSLSIDVFGTAGMDNLSSLDLFDDQYMPAGGIGLNDIANLDALSAIVNASVTNVEGESISEEDVSRIGIVLVSAITGQDTSGAVPTITYEVHPEAIAYRGETAIGSAVITNDQLKPDAEFSFRLGVPDALVIGDGDKHYVKVTHKFSDGTEEQSIEEIKGTAGGYYVDLTASSFSEFELEAVSVTVEGRCTVSKTLSLAEEFKINLYVKDIVGNPADYEITYGSTTKKVSEGEEVNGKYKFMIGSFSSKQMTNTVDVTIKYGGEVIYTLEDYSIRQYCRNMINKTSNARFEALCRATLDYGAAAQEYFDKATSGLANEDGYGAGEDALSGDVVPEDFKEPEGNRVMADGVTKITSSLNLESRVELNFYFYGYEGTLDDTTVSVTGASGSDVAYEKLNGKVRVTIKNIPSNKLSDWYTVSVGNSSLSYSPMTYAYKHQGDGNALAKLCKALYLYATKAHDYFTTT